MEKAWSSADSSEGVHQVHTVEGYRMVAKQTHEASRLEENFQRSTRPNSSFEKGGPWGTVCSQPSMDAGSASTPRSCLYVEEKRLPGGTTGTMQLWARGPELATIYLICRWNLAFLPCPCCFCYHPHAGSGPYAWPDTDASLARLLTCFPAQTTNMQIAPCSVSSAGRTLPFSTRCHLPSVHGDLGHFPHNPWSLSDHLRPKWSLPPLKHRNFYFPSHSFSTYHMLLCIVCLVSFI